MKHRAVPTVNLCESYSTQGPTLKHALTQTSHTLPHLNTLTTTVILIHMQGTLKKTRQYLMLKQERSIFRVLKCNIVWLSKHKGKKLPKTNKLPYNIFNFHVKHVKSNTSVYERSHNRI